MEEGAGWLEGRGLAGEGQWMGAALMCECKVGGGAVLMGERKGWIDGEEGLIEEGEVGAGGGESSSGDMIRAGDI